MTLFPACRSLLRHLAAATSGVAAVEFGLSLPALLTLGLYGTETANFALTNMRVSQLAMRVADDASRIGEESMLQDKKIYESDINDLVIGGQLQSTALNLLRNGRVIISSLEVDTATNRQYIHWQRCKGAKVVSSAYGPAGTGLAGGLSGMGPAGNQVTATAGDAVMFVEITYDYQPLVSATFAPVRTITTSAAFNVRDSRDLSQIYQKDVANPAPVASCSTYSAS